MYHYLILVLFISLSINQVYSATLIRATGDEVEWWQHAKFYQIYPRSFQDSDGDGIGDLKGITSRLPHLKYLGFDAIWLSPIFKSPQVDVGYDVSDFFDIEADYGTLDDFDDMMRTVKELGLRVLLDYVPNHTSDQHEWFIKSVQRDPEYDNYYIWNSGKIVDGERQPPNNWISTFADSAWTLNEDRDEYYYHQFSTGQPDLNYREPKVLEEMGKVLTFWLERGVDGFRFDAINHMFEDELLRDEPVRDCCQGTYDALDHIYTKDVDGVYEVVRDWRQILEDWKVEYGGESRIIMTEAYANTSFTMKYYQSDDGTEQRAHMPFNFQLIYIDSGDLYPERVMSAVNEWLLNMPEGKTPNWVLGSHDHTRSASKHSSTKIELMNTLLLTLPGVSITYYGEEIGMLDNLDFDITDSRDVNRTPMQWDEEPGTGFSTTLDTWLPIHSNYRGINVENQKGVPFTHLEQLRLLNTLKNEEAMKRGSFAYKILPNDVLVFTRELIGYDTFIIVFNFAGQLNKIDLTEVEELPETLTVEIVTIQSRIDYKVGQTIDSTNLLLSSYDAIVLRG